MISTTSEAPTAASSASLSVVVRIHNLSFTEVVSFINRRNCRERRLYGRAANAPERRSLSAPRDVRRDAQAGAPSIVPLRRRTDSGTAAERWTSPWSLSRIKNIFYYSYIRCLKTLPSHADAIARSIGGVLGSPRVHSLDLRIRGLGDRSGRVRTFRRVPTTLSGVLGTRLVLRIGRR